MLHAWHVGRVGLACIVYTTICAAYTRNPALMQKQCATVSDNSRTSWTRFEMRRGLLLVASPLLFEQQCDGVVLDTTSNSGVFEHDVFASDHATTVVFMQVSLYNPQESKLRLAVGGIVVVLNHTHTRTHARRMVPTNTMASQHPPTVHAVGGILKRQRLQELQVSFVRRGNVCIVFLPTPVNHVQQQVLCHSSAFFHVHGSNVNLHSVVVQVNLRREAMWDFSLRPIGAHLLCGVCPPGTTAHRNHGSCSPCLSGFRVNVKATSAWWYNANRSTSTMVVPEPDWAVLEVNNLRQSTGIMRYSSRTNNGNMILTQHDRVYKYEDERLIPRVCTDSYEVHVRTRRNEPVAPDKCRVPIIVAKMYIGLIFSNIENIRVRALLLQQQTWETGDTVEFCDHTTISTLAPHVCGNTVMLTYWAQSKWIPNNVDPVHRKYTRYIIRSKNDLTLLFS